jgi:hypothetical protein
MHNSVSESQDHCPPKPGIEDVRSALNPREHVLHEDSESDILSNKDPRLRGVGPPALESQIILNVVFQLDTILKQRQVELGRSNGDTEPATSFAECENSSPTSGHDNQFHDTETIVGDRLPEASHSSAPDSLVSPDVLVHWVPVLLDHLGSMPASAGKCFVRLYCLVFLVKLWQAPHQDQYAHRIPGKCVGMKSSTK